ncbi:MAG TPA: hypothetical protein VK921_16545 [Anditalea sp.]|nr:hypothetical protein [Anditalea sp.]
MYIIKKYSMLVLMMVFMSSCILEEVEPEYDVVGAIGTISNLTASSTTPTEGQTITFTVNFYSEHEAARELRMNQLVGGTPNNITTRTFSSWNTEDSYVETFQYQVPDGSAGTTINMQFELITESNFTTTRTINLVVAPGS